MAEKENKTKLDDTITGNVYLRLQRARVALQNLNIKKSGENKYSGFKYFELKDFIPPLNEILLNNGLSTNFSVVERQANLFVINTDNPEENILFTSPIAEAPLKGCTPIQSVGAVHTYMKRYLYLNALEIVEDDILDKNAGNFNNQNNQKADKQQQFNPKVTLFKKLKEKQLTNDEMNAFCTHYGIDGKNDNSIQNFLRKGDMDKYIDDFKSLEAINV